VNETKFRKELKEALEKELKDYKVEGHFGTVN
jgi:hypothetical protein